MARDQTGRHAGRDRYTLRPGTQDWAEARLIIKQFLDELGVRSAGAGEAFHNADALQARLAQAGLLVVKLLPVDDAG